MQDAETSAASAIPSKPTPPPLFHAARLGDHESIRQLVAAGADVNAQADIDSESNSCFLVTPLMVAAGSGEGASVETVRLFISLGADPAVSIRSGTAAEFACKGLGWDHPPGGDAARLQMLLDAGSPLPLQGEPGARLVADVAEIGDAARLAVLLRRGAPANACFDPERARQHYLAMKARMREYRQAQPDPLKNLPESVRESLRQSELEREKEEVERAVSAPGPFEIPLFQAAASGSIECVTLLLEAGADVHQRDDGRQTALWHASSADVASLLVARGLNIEDTDWLEWTPLRANLCSPKRVAALIAAGANVNATYDSGYTIFMSAVGSGRDPQVLRLLVEAGADPLAASDHGYNAFHAAIDVDGAEANAETSVRATFAYLKSLRVDIEAKTQGGQTPLARAIDRGTGMEVRVLCELGANPNAAATFHRCGSSQCGAHEELPLFAATRAAVYSGEKTAALLRAGADVLATDAEGHAALTRAVAKLASDAADYETSFRAFYKGLNALSKPPIPRASTPDEFVAALQTPIREYVEAFARAIPLDDAGDFAVRSRAELVSTIVALVAFETCARSLRAGPSPQV